MANHFFLDDGNALPRQCWPHDRFEPNSESKPMTQKAKAWGKTDVNIYDEVLTLLPLLGKEYNIQQSS